MSNGALPSRPSGIGQPRSKADGHNGSATTEFHPMPSAMAPVVLLPPHGGRLVSRFLYWSCYYVSYRIVFSTFFIASFVPGSGPLTAGLTDGAKAASASVSHKRATQAARRAAG